MAEELPEDDPDSVWHEGTGKLRLARLHVWAPPSKGKVNIEKIEDCIADLDQRFRLRVGADPWQAAYLIERLKKRNISIEAVDFVGANLKSMCSATLEAFSENRIELYPDPLLLADLRSLRVIEKSYGVRLDSPRGVNGHGDCATALSIALLLISRKIVFSAQQFSVNYDHVQERRGGADGQGRFDARKIHTIAEGRPHNEFNFTQRGEDVFARPRQGRRRAVLHRKVGRRPREDRPTRAHRERRARPAAV